MSPRLKISISVIQRLKKLRDGCHGRLYGISDDKSILVLGFDLSNVGEEPQNGIDLEKILGHDIIPNLPAGVNQCGAFQVTNVEDLNDFGDDFLDCVGYEYPVVINFDSTSKKITSGFHKNGKVEKSEFVTVDNSELVKSFMHFRVTAIFPLISDVDIKCVEQTLNNLEKKILSSSFAFHFEESEVYILGDKDTNIIGLTPKSPVKELIKGNSQDRKKEDGHVVVDVRLLMNQTVKGEGPFTAPYIVHIKKEFKQCELDFCLDTLVITAKTLPVCNLYQLLITALHRNFILNKDNLLSQLEKGKIYDVGPPETYHFLPSDLGHFFSIVYGPKQSIDDLKEIRESFHILFSLPMDRPLFRQANAYDFSNSVKTNSNLLMNPHESVAKSGVADGEAQFVQGNYAYHHYMQDGFDDNGWGCAYRSLQTIFSWFRSQGYTNLPVPSHKDIQQCLVNIGDKPRSFVGSRQWIGSTEVSFVLDTMLGVTSRIVSVSSGEEMTMKGGELSHHFKTQGTPIMIGGGVLAHTILGVDYNKHTGDIKFLILDPHYTGQEDLSLIIKKGWCGWKGPEFWKKDAFYNMCLPLKPKCV